MVKRNLKFTDEMKAEQLCFRKGIDDWAAECLVCNLLCLEAFNIGSV